MNISFALTTRQIRTRSKWVTRRLGWQKLRAGTVLCAVERCRGLGKGEELKRICLIRVVSVRRERLDEITKAECIAEGFPEFEPSDFIRMFCDANKCEPSEIITRIEFEYV